MPVEDNDPFARIAALEARIAQLEAQRAPAAAVDARSGDHPVSRRRVLGMAGAAAAGAAAASVAAVASPAAATDGDAITVGGSFTNNNPGGQTLISGSTNVGNTAIVRVSQGGSTGLTAAVRGDLTGTAVDGAGVQGSDSGTSNLGAGVIGESTGSGTNRWGVIARRFSGTGGGGGLIAATTLQDNAGVSAGSDNGPSLWLFNWSNPTPPTSGTWKAGQFLVSGGQLWYCIADGVGTASKWVRLSSPLVTLASPVRVYDSRSGQPNQSPNTQGSLTFSSAPPSSASREVACNKDASTGTVVVPSGATALLLNLAIVSISGVGALNVYATGTTQPATANINWFAGGQVLSNAVTSACNASQHVNVAIVAGAGAATHFIIDVIGYYP